MTVRATIFTAFVTLVTSTLGASAKVEQSRDAATQPTPDKPPYVLVYDGGDAVTQKRVGSTVRTCVLKVEGHVAKTSSAALDQAMDDLYAALVVGIEASSKLSGKCIALDEVTYEPTIVQATGASAEGAFELTYHATYATASGNPSVSSI